MLVDAPLEGPIAETRRTAATIESDGYDGIWTGETGHDPFLQLLLAAEATQRIAIGSGVAIAFARSPMTLAYSAYDLAQYAQGRFVLGLGSQVKPHIERRFSMPWSHPAARMRELVLALRAIWAAWQDGAPLKFEGEFYRHTLMPPAFSPQPHRFGPPPVCLAGVGPLMTEVAGEVCDGFLFHPLTTERYMREVTFPALERGRARAGKSGLDDFTIAGAVFTCTGRDEKELAAAIRGIKSRIAFYASTPAYRSVLDLHGWGDLQPELTRLSKQGRWTEMGDAIDDEVLRAFAVIGEPTSVGRALHARWAGCAGRIMFYAAYESDPSVWPAVVQAIRAAARGRIPTHTSPTIAPDPRRRD